MAKPQLYPIQFDPRIAPVSLDEIFPEIVNPKLSHFEQWESRIRNAIGNSIRNLYNRFYSPKEEPIKMDTTELDWKS